jgi:hypothetical protein
MSARAATITDEILARGAVTEADVLALRRSFYEDGLIDRDEAEALLRLERETRSDLPGWRALLVEAVTDHIVNATPPEGYITADNARWLIGATGGDAGRGAVPAELDLLVSVLEHARWSPASLVAHALDQIKGAVLRGCGPTRDGEEEPADRPVITDDEVALLRRILYAFGGDGGVAVTRAEAEVLFEINDAIAGGPANAAFTDLFCKAIANCVMAASGYHVPSREEALSEQEWLDRRGDLSPAAMLASIVHNGLAGIWSAYREQSGEERALARLERQRIEIITNEEITEGEAGWLAERIGRDGKLTTNEAALVAYLVANSPRLHPSLAARIDRLAKAA